LNHTAREFGRAGRRPSSCGNAQRKQSIIHEVETNRATTDLFVILDVILQGSDLRQTIGQQSTMTQTACFCKAKTWRSGTLVCTTSALVQQIIHTITSYIQQLYSNNNHGHNAMFAKLSVPSAGAKT